MKKLLTFSLLLIVSLVVNAQAPSWLREAGCRKIDIPDKEYSVAKYGAKPGSANNVAKLVQKAIDACSKAGGGKVVFPAETYVMGAIFIKSNVQLVIGKDVLILGSESLNDYPDIDTRVAGIEMKWPAALINVIDAKNVSVTGNGVIDARGKFNWDLYWKMRKEYDAKDLRWIVDYDVKRVRTVLVQNSENVLVKDLTMKSAGFWTVQILYSKYVTASGLTIKNNENCSGPSTDGIDIDSSSWVLIDGCDIDCNDDNFCLKAGRDWDGLRVNKPTEYVVIQNSIARRGAGLITLGSETSGGIRHIFATNLKAKHTDNGLRIKSATTRGGTIEDIYFENIEMDSINNAFQFNLNWFPAYSYSTLPRGYSYDSIPAHWKAMLQHVEPAEKGIPHAKDIYVKNVRVTNAKKVFDATGLPSSLLSNFQFENTSITASEFGKLEFVSSWNMQGLKVSIDSPVKVESKASSIEEKERLQ
ncbi:glycoside hydrolase family 28 protein [Chitinophagaceae bacterium 26-R-25]|nr:glycoside hydrolase family 28 protein [Chitinophagaceae bacterium 26-R-25]